MALFAGVLFLTKAAWDLVHKEEELEDPFLDDDVARAEAAEIEAVEREAEAREAQRQALHILAASQPDHPKAEEYERLLRRLALVREDQELQVTTKIRHIEETCYSNIETLEERERQLTEAAEEAQSAEYEAAERERDAAVEAAEIQYNFRIDTAQEAYEHACAKATEDREAGVRHEEEQARLHEEDANENFQKFEAQVQAYTETIEKALDSGEDLDLTEILEFVKRERHPILTPPSEPEPEEEPKAHTRYSRILDDDTF